MKQFETSQRLSGIVHALSLALVVFFVIPAQGQGAKQTAPGASIRNEDADHIQERSAWFLRGRMVRGTSGAELRRRAYEAKLATRAARSARSQAAAATAPSLSSGSWTPLGPLPLASDATGSGIQDYHQVAGRATSIAIDPADPTGNTVYIGGAQGGVWKSTNAANTAPLNVTWTPMTDDQATLSTGSIAIQPGNTDPAKSLILVGTGEADNSGDSYFGLGILRSADAGNNWTLISTANGGALPFSGLGATHMAFSTTSTVVAAMATTSEGMIDGAVTSATSRGLYTSTDAGLTWTYNALFDPGNQATDATSSTAVVYNAAAGLFFASVRYHGFYSSPNGVTWTRLASQPGGTVLSATSCPPLSTTNSHACPIYRAEISVVPGTGRNEMYAWFISLDSNGNSVDEGIWESTNGGMSWTAINDSGITNCGDSSGCGVQQGFYNLALLAVPNGNTATDLYAGAINIYKCSISSINPACASFPFINLTHVYGCSPLSAPAHVHPDQHAMGYVIPNAGSDAGNDLMYFANDGGIYRALNGFSLKTGLCSGTNPFDDLNQNLGSMTQFVSFSQHPSDAATLLGGTQDNGSPATQQAGTTTYWVNVLGGDGGYNAIDPSAPSNWFASNPDVGGSSLSILECPSGFNCNDGSFSAVVTSSDLGGDDGAFYFPYILDPQSTTALLVGTCRVWRGPRLGGGYTILSPNFDTFGSGVCTGGEVNTVRALAAGGPKDSSGFSNVIYATTDGFGPIDSSLFPTTGGHVWVSTNATAGPNAFTEVTQNINPNQFPISSVAIDTSDPSGSTAYVTVMGFTGGAGHVWQTTNAGATWTDFTGAGSSGLKDSPANVVIVDASAHTVYVGTDVGVFQSSTVNPGWTEVGPLAGTIGFLPNVAVTGLAIFNSGGKKLLRASTYGRGMWQLDLLATPDYQVAFSNTPQTIFPGQTATFNGTLTALNQYNSSVALTCTPGTTVAPSPCNINPTSPTPTPAGAPFTVAAGGGTTTQDYNFKVHGVGSDSNQTMHDASLSLHVVDFGLTTPSPSTVTVPRGTASAPTTFQVTAAGSFNQSVAVACSSAIAGATCTLTPGQTVNPVLGTPVTMTASVTVPVNTTAGTYTINIQATTANAPAALTTSFALNVTSNPTFVLTEPTAFPEVNAGSSNVSGPISIASQDSFSGTVALTCSIAAVGGSCSVTPTSVSSFPATATVTVNAAAVAAGAYQLSVQGTSAATTHVLAIPINVGDYLLSGTQSLTVAPGAQAIANLTITSSNLYSGTVTATCDTGALTGATCALTPTGPIILGQGAVAPVTATISVPSNGVSGAYKININTQDTTGTPSHNLAIMVDVGDYELAVSQPFGSVDAGAQPQAAVTITPKASFQGSVTAACDASALSGTQCSLSQANPIVISTTTVTLRATLNVPNGAAPGTYNININTQDGTLSHSVSIPLTVIQDFSVNSATPSQTIKAGQTTGAYQLTISPAPAGSSFPGLVTLSCSAGLPSGAQCSFTPNVITPTGNAPDVVMIISTVATSGRLQRGSVVYALWLALPGIFVICGASSRRRQRGAVGSMFALLLLITTLSCGGAGSTGPGGGGGGGQQSTKFTVTITGASGSLTHNTQVDLLITK